MPDVAVTIRRITSAPILTRVMAQMGYNITYPERWVSIGDAWISATITVPDTTRHLAAALVVVEYGGDFPERVGHWRLIEPQDKVCHSVQCLALGCGYTTLDDCETNAVNWMLARSHWLDNHLDISESPFDNGHHLMWSSYRYGPTMEHVW